MGNFWSLFLLSAIAFAAHPAPALAALDWWQTAIFYQIYPRSFKDSNGDGVGDLTGITEKLDHLKDIDVQGVWMSPVYPSPMADFGYDISDFKNIHPLFGTLEDFDALLAKAKELDIKVVMDFVPNHSSDEHEWFIKSVRREDPYTDYYMWNDGLLDAEGNRVPPNNWQGAFGGGSAWKWVEERQQYYFHYFHEKQPDLNYSNPLLVEEMKDVLRFWIDRGVSGFRVDAVPCLFEGPPEAAPPEQTASPQHLPETYDMVKQWRQVIDEKSAEYGETKVFMLEVYGTLEQMMGYYGTPESPGGHFPFNFRFISDVRNTSTASDFSAIINDYLGLMISNRWPNWVLGNHDNHRVGSRFGPQLIDGMNMLDLLLPGVGVTYNGEEIGMLDTYVTWEQCQDPSGINAGPEHYLETTRDLERTPFQWDSTTSAGFSTNASTWLPLNENYLELNLEHEKSIEKSHYQVYKRLSQLRQTPTVQLGQTQAKALSNKVLGFSRSLEGEDTFIVLVNLGEETEVVDVSQFGSLPEMLSVHTVCVHCAFSSGNAVPANHVQILAKEAFVLTTGSI